MAGFSLITGGARSGKSRFAELLAAQAKLPVTYIATAQVWDEEMAVRVAKHRAQRPHHWGLVEEPVNILEVLREHKDENGVILLDCVTLWLSNLLLGGMSATQAQGANLVIAEPSPAKLDEIEAEILALVKAVGETAATIKPKVIFVTNEVGQGIVPENYLARVYRDLSGRCNQVLAQAAETVYLMVAGYPLEVKSGGQQILKALSEE